MRGAVKNMLTRIITSVVALAVFFAVIFAGELPLVIAVLIVTAAMLFETYSAVTGSAAVKVSGYITAAIVTAGVYADMTGAALSAAILIILVFLVFLHGKVRYRELLSVSFMSVYIALFMSYIPLLRINMGLAYMAFVFIIAWGSDTCAYFCGTFFGKHKLIPKVSPKKTVEGSVGAIISVMLLCMLYALILDKSGHPLGGVSPEAADYIKIGLLGAVTAAVSQLGDLAASAIKRDTGIKDYGKIFPGHGGFMDRFDSVIFIAPVVYYYCVYIIII